MELEKGQGYTRYRLPDDAPAEQAGRLITQAVGAAKAQGLKRLLIDLNRMSATRRLSMTECYSLGEDLARAGTGLWKVAFVMDARCMKVHQFTLNVAANRGLEAVAFANEVEALQWLLSA